MLQSPKLHLSWSRLFTHTILAVYAYVGMEWLFFATKSSFMDALPITKKLEILFLTGLVLTVFVLPFQVLLWLLDWIPGWFKKRKVFRLIGGISPALFAAATTLLMVDNFTYTLFKFGIVSTQGAARGVYGVFAIFLTAVWYRQVLLGAESQLPVYRIEKVSTSKSKSIPWQKIQTWTAVGGILISLIVGLMRVSSEAIVTGEESALLQPQTPHIILLGGEGIIAKRMSLYGYERDTTPHLRQLAETGLLAENNFSNAAHTTGSVISMLTGKYPAETRLLYSPNILLGLDAYQHLPGILQRLGYTTHQITFPYYIDAYDLNLQEGFDEVNGRSIGQGKIFQLARQYHLEDIGYFIPRLSERIFDRLLHIFYLQTMPDPYRQVIEAVDPNTAPTLSDEERIQKLIRLLLDADGPVFAHVHLMDTHGENFYPRKRVFSVGERQDQAWMTDFYDDAVLDFDAYVGELVAELSQSDLLEKTVLVIDSDHADQWRVDDRIPLLFRFPQGDYAGRIPSNTQNLDIAPTLLDYLGLEIPAWMSGQSLLTSQPSSTRPIISAGVVGVDCNRPGWWCVIDPVLVAPPFYQFGYFQVVVCQKMFTLVLASNHLSVSDVTGHTAPCEVGSLPTSAQVREVIREHLEQNGFDVSTLK
jgi:arylsulfatase A-like enzyme